jgi:hypothetical protein
MFPDSREATAPVGVSPNAIEICPYLPCTVARPADRDLSAAPNLELMGNFTQKIRILEERILDGPGLIAHGFMASGLLHT